MHEGLCEDVRRYVPDPATTRKRQVLQGLLRGLSVKQIALALKISPNTVQVYKKQIHREYGVGSRGELLSLWIPDTNIDVVRGSGEFRPEYRAAVHPRFILDAC